MNLLMAQEYKKIREGDRNPVVKENKAKIKKKKKNRKINTQPAHEVKFWK